ncbi:MAG TPA: DUF4019 domain-containing protein [Allosphingosinicella sp.]|jgi:hypothetical protein
MTPIPALLSALLLQAAQPSPEVTHERLGENSYRLHIRIQSAEQLDAAHRMMAERMRSLCGALHPILGRWETTAPLATGNPTSSEPAIDIHQELTCSAERPAPPATPPLAVVDPSWTPGSADHETIRAASNAFLDAREAGRYAEAYGWLAATFRATETLAEFSEANDSLNRRAGRRLERRLAAITWYNNTLEGAPPGLYAAVDFVGAFEGLYFSCGYLIWQLQADRTWRLVTLNQSIVARADAPNATAEEIASLRREMRCRD